MQSLWHHVGDHGLAVCSNGGIVYDVPGRRGAQARPIARDVGLEVADLVRDAVPGTTFAVERADGFGHEPEFHSRGDRVPGFEPQVAALPDLFEDRQVVKMLARHEQLPPEDYWARVEAAVGHAVTTTWSSVGALVEMSAAGVTKASTLELLCAELGVGDRKSVV